MKKKEIQSELSKIKMTQMEYDLYLQLIKDYKFEKRIDYGGVHDVWVKSEYRNNEKFRYHIMSINFFEEKEYLIEFHTNYIFPYSNYIDGDVLNDMNYIDAAHGVNFETNSVKELQEMLFKYFPVESRKLKLKNIID